VDVDLDELQHLL